MRIELVIRALVVGFAIVALEWTKLGWHSRESWALLAVHSLLALLLLLAGLWVPWLALVAVLVVLVSWADLPAKRCGVWHGVLLSGLSSLPWEAAALWSLGWPWALVGVPAAYVSGWLWVTRRPSHWTPSRWTWLFLR